jgi:predicted nuclease of restriction endonuclease-like (RecB) superfamily
MKFDGLLQLIHTTSATLQQGAVKAINRMLTIRNWLIGYYIVEYEQYGEDRAAYGERLIDKLAESLDDEGLSGRNLKLYRQFYLVYPQIGHTLPALLNSEPSIWQSVVAQFHSSENQEFIIMQSPIAQLDQKPIPGIMTDPMRLISNLSYTHLVQLLSIDEPLKRVFYETECIKGTWSVRGLRRQISTLYYERSGMSRKPELLSGQLQFSAEQQSISEIIKSPFTFEFLGLKAKDVVYESDLEQALIENLQEFMLELGHGICFEARQKRIVIGDEYFFIDLVFYHRILKCHVLVELKTKEVKHEHIGQLNVYLNYYKEETMQPGDNPPVGILLVTEGNRALVEYATAGMDEKLFVSKYLVELPSKKQLEEFIIKELQQLK